MDKNQPIVRVMTMDRMMAITETERRFVLILFEAFALLALLLAPVGMYGVLSGNVTERTREIGVRAALGASRGDLLALILRDGIRLAAVGIGMGLCGAIVAARAIATLLFGTSPLDPIAWVGVILMLAGVSHGFLLGACLACVARRSLDHAAIRISLEPGGGSSPTQSDCSCHGKPLSRKALLNLLKGPRSCVPTALSGSRSHL